jgi:hypothetical protein
MQIKAKLREEAAIEHASYMFFVMARASIEVKAKAEE